MPENEYIPEQESEIEDLFENVSKKSKQSKKSKTTQTSKKSNSEIATSAFKFDREKIKTIFGTFLLISSLFLFVACLSYLFTWKHDQDKVLNKSFFEFIFSNDQIPVDNWLGKIGAWVSHFFIYGLFGIPTFAFCFILFLVSAKVLFNRNLLPLKTTSINTLFLATWSSLFLGYFANHVNYLGGSIGFYTNEWLSKTFGFGSIILHIGLLYILVTILFRPNYGLLLSFLQDRKKMKVPHEEKSNNSFFKKEEADFKIVNPIKEEEIENEYISEPIVFDEDE
jgi:S-DNA-T family DNA segregation ATPase FtsK/SpoIIIE